MLLLGTIEQYVLTIRVHVRARLWLTAFVDGLELVV